MNFSACFRRRVPITLGAASYCDGSGPVVLRAHYALRDLRVTVFADLARVEVRGIYLGTQVLHAALGECPVAYFEGEWAPGIELRVDCVPRRPYESASQ